MKAVRYGIALVALVVTVVIVQPEPARAWTCLESSCPAWCTAAPYALTVYSNDLGESTSVSELQRGFDDWSEVTCTDLATSYTGRSTVRAGDSDGTSAAGWVHSGWRHDSNAIGVTGPSWNPRTGCINEADMELNSVNFYWLAGSPSGFTSGRSEVNAYSIILHESGHYYGLGHSNDRNATMYFAYSGGIDTLSSDDQNAICSLYPEGGMAPDCTEIGCPSGQTCVDGACVAIVGDGSVCSPCTSSTDCSGAGVCLRYPDGVGYCGKSCSTSAECGTADCVDTDLGGQCVRFDEFGSPDCSATSPECNSDSDCEEGFRCNGSGECEELPTTGFELGDVCARNSDCNSGLCLTTASGRFCSQSCDWLDVESCPGGFYCNGTASGSCGDGVCLSGNSGSLSLGASCTADTDCDSLLCASGTCATPCIPGGATAACPGGFQCQPGATSECGACRQVGSIGDDCSSASDCASRLCVSTGEEFFCSQRCDNGEACPVGFTCFESGDLAVCQPAVVEGVAPADLGDPCDGPSDCTSGLCVSANGETACSAECTSDAQCGAGFECADAGTTSVCIADPNARRGGGCGISANSTGAGAWTFLLGLPAFVWMRRRMHRRR